MPPSADLNAPEGRLVGGEVAVRGAKVALQFNGVAGGERDHRLQPERRRLGDMRPADLAGRATDLGRAVQREPSTHPRRRAGVDLVEERRAEEVGAVHGRHKAVVRGVEGALIVVVRVVDGDLRPGPDADIVVVVGVRLEPGQPGLVDDAGGVVDAEPVEEGAAVGRDCEPEPVRAEEPNQRLGHEAGLQGQPEIVARGLLVHGVEEIARAALGHGLCRPERSVQLGRERVRPIRRRAEPQECEVLQRRRRRADPAVLSDECEPVSARTVALSLMPRRVDAIQRERRRGSA